jgi:hypothetical protein
MERVLWAQTETARAWPDITAPVLRSLPYAADRCHTLILTARAVPPASRPQNLVEGLCGVVVDYQRLSRAVAETVTMAAAASVVVPPGREYGDGVMTVDEAIAELEGVRAWYASYAGGVI